MINIAALVAGIPVEELVPNYRSLLGDLAGQKKKQEEQELETGLGPEPTRSNMTPGEHEMYQLKRMSRTAIGGMIVSNLNKGIEVLSIVDENGDEADVYVDTWLENDMDSKLEIFKPDYRQGGWGFWEMRIENGRRVIKLKSPKRVTTFYSDSVNNQWADYAIETFVNGGENYFRYFDASVILTFKQNKDKEGYFLETWESHSLGVCPIVGIPNKMTSDGEVSGDTENLKPNFDTYRQRSNAISQAAYWTGSRTLVVEGLDGDEVRYDPTTEESYNVAERFMESVCFTDAGVVMLPSGSNGSNPSLSQTEEGNLGQLVETKNDAKRDLVAVTGLPPHLFGFDAPSTGEATVQSFLTANDNKRKDKQKIGRRLEMMLSQLVYATTGERRRYTIVWAVSEQVSINSLADTMSKMVAAGFPLAWVVRHVLAGYRPTQIKELLLEIEGRDGLAAEQAGMLLNGIR